MQGLKHTWLRHFWLCGCRTRLRWYLSRRQIVDAMEVFRRQQATKPSLENVLAKLLDLELKYCAWHLHPHYAKLRIVPNDLQRDQLKYGVPQPRSTWCANWSPFKRKVSQNRSPTKWDFVLRVVRYLAISPKRAHCFCCSQLNSTSKILEIPENPASPQP